MSGEAINLLRYRGLLVGAAGIAAIFFSAAYSVFNLPERLAWEWQIFLAGGVLCLLLLVLAMALYARGRRDELVWIGAVLFLITGALALLRIYGNMHGTAADAPGYNRFRPVFTYLPLLYIAYALVMPPRVAMRMSWGLWLLVVLVCLSGLRQHGLELQRPGELQLLVWLLVANPLFILGLYLLLPRYEEALRQSTTEVAQLRERNALMERLSESEHRFNLVVQALQVGVWDQRRTSTTQRWWSPRYYELLGYTPEELPPTSESIRKLTHPDDQPQVIQAINELSAKGMTAVELRYRTKHGGYRWFAINAKAEKSAEGVIVRVAGSIADVHEQRMAEQALREAKNELMLMAYRDTLSQLPNRRAFDERFKDEWALHRQRATPLSILLIDLDYFKAYNDSCGHAAGDECLRKIAEVISLSLRRPADFAARLGGEEFAVLLPDTGSEGALRVAEAIRSGVRGLAITHSASPIGVVTLSVGVALAAPAEPGEATQIFEHADRALYQSKDRGRDVVSLYASDL